MKELIGCRFGRISLYPAGVSGVIPLYRPRTSWETCVVGRHTSLPIVGVVGWERSWSVHDSHAYNRKWTTAYALQRSSCAGLLFNVTLHPSRSVAVLVRV